MKHNKHLAFCLFALCASVVLFNDCVIASSKTSQIENSVYAGFVNELATVAQKSGYIDLTDINLKKLSEVGFDTLYKAVQDIMFNPDNKGETMTLLLNPLNSELKCDEYDLRLKKLQKLTKETSHVKLVLPALSNPKKIVTCDQYFAEWFMTELKRAKATNIFNVSLFALENMEEADIGALKAKMVKLALCCKSGDTPITVIVRSNSLRSNEVSKNLQEVAEIASKCQINLCTINRQDSCALANSCYISVRQAITAAYDTNIIDLRFIGGYNLNEGDLCSMYADLKDFVRNYLFEFGPVKIIVPKNEKLVRKLTEQCALYENKFEISADKEHNAYDKYIKNVVKSAHKSGLLDLTSINTDNFSDKEIERYGKMFGNYIEQDVFQHLPKVVCTKHNNVTEMIKSGIRNNKNGIQNLISKIVVVNDDKIDVSVASRDTVIQDLNRAYKTNRFTNMWFCTSDLLKTKLSQRAVKKSIKDFKLYGMYSPEQKKKFKNIGAEVYVCDDVYDHSNTVGNIYSYNLMEYITDRTEESCVTKVIDLSDIGSKLINTDNASDTLSAYIINFCFDNKDDKVNTLVTIRNKKDMKFAKTLEEKVMKRLKKIKLNNFQLNIIDKR